MSLVIENHSLQVSEDFIVRWIGPEGEREGPLYVLWQLIESYQVDIFNVSLTKITEDFLNYLQQSNVLKLEIASSFLQIASKLLYYKSKILLPDPGFEEEEQDRLPKEIISQLLEYRKFQKAAEMLQQIEEVAEGIYTRNNLDLVIEGYEESYNFNDLIRSYINLMKKKYKENNNKKKFLEIDLETITVEKKIEFIKSIISEKKHLEFFQLLENRDFFSILEIIVTFLAILELAKQKEIVIEQKHIFGSIFIFKRTITVR